MIYGFVRICSRSINILYFLFIIVAEYNIVNDMTWLRYDDNIDYQSFLTLIGKRATATSPSSANSV